jgi:predicted metal-dependent phosphoesterase TrpH
MADLCAAQSAVAVAVDEYFVTVLAHPAETDAGLRRDGMTGAADRLVELFGPRWWEHVQQP